MHASLRLLTAFTFGVLLVGLLAGCSTTPTTNHEQTYEASLADGKVMLLTLQNLDTGDVAKTRRVGMTSLHVTLSILAKSATRFRRLPEQTDEGLTLARDALDYMLKHREELDPRLPTVKIGMRALQQILTDPESILRLSELSVYLAGVEKSMSDGKQE